MSLGYPVVIAPTRTVNLGTEILKRERLVAEMNTQSLTDVRALLRNITIEQAAQQIALGNPPAIVEVDGRADKDVLKAERRTVILFGTTLAAAAMRLVEMELAAAISASTQAHSGRLRATSSSWKWLYVPKGGSARQVSSGQTLPTFASGDVLVLVPQEVPYATLTNRNVARSGKLSVAPRKGKSLRRELQNIGFLATAARAVRRRAEFKQFAVVAEFTKAHMVPGELMTRESGTGYIKIRPRFRRTKV